MTALVNYAESIESIVDSGNNGAKSAKEVFGAAEKLAETLEVLPAGGSAAAFVDVAGDAFVFAYDQIAKMRAGKQLEHSLSEIGPGMEASVKFISGLVKNSQTVFEKASKLRKDELLVEGGKAIG